MALGHLKRNTLLNLVGQGAPLLVAVVSIPFVTSAMGPERFGVLALAWTFIGYFAVFDLGLGRSLTQRVAELLGEAKGEAKEDAIPSVTWTGVISTLALGVLGAGCVLLASGALVRSVLRIPPELSAESLRALRILGLSLPFVLSTNALRGVLEAYQRFEIVNLLRAPVMALTFLGPLAVVPFTVRLDVVVTVLVLIRVIAWVAHAAFCIRVNPDLARPRAPRRAGAESLFRMGGWLTVSNVISPVLVYADRFLIGSVLSMSALAFYTTPSEVVMRVVTAPVAVAGVFFPAFAASFRSDPERTARLFSSSVRAVLLMLFPILLTMFVFAEIALRAWVGDEFALHGTAVARWLVLGVLFNGLAQIPLALVHGAARADITARLHMWEAPFYLALLWWLLDRHGLPGAAVAWSTRTGVDAALLFLAAGRVVPLTGPVIRATAGWTLGCAALLALSWWLVELGAPGRALLVPLALFAVAGWRYLMRPEWRAALLLRARAARHRARAAD